MNIDTILFIVSIFIVTAAFDESEHNLNVGSVLFTTNDLKNNRWNKSNVGLLYARKHFQSFIPPVDLINTLNEDNIDELMEYFETSYTSIKTEAKDSETDRILTKALSDVIGGYLKSWVLPITKYAFYGGAVTQNRAVKLFKFYDELKNYMGTDGRGWTIPDPNLLSSIYINVAEFKHNSNTRSMLDPCNNFAFFLKTPTGLSIPTPSINWNKQSNTMFIPLTNHSLIPLNAYNSSNALFKYYDAAKNCIQSGEQSDQENFEQRFQNWLYQDVVPHLNDDNLYLAFGSILSLVNTSENLYNGVKDMKELLNSNNRNHKKKFFVGSMPIDLKSKKILIITIILFLEVGWCIPALMYILCSKKRKENSSNVYMFVERNSDSENNPKEGLNIEKRGKRSEKKEIYETQSKVEINMARQYQERGCFLEMPPHVSVATNFSSVSKTSKGTAAQSFYSSKLCSAEMSKIIYEAPIIDIHSSVKDINSIPIDTIPKEPEKSHKLCTCTFNQNVGQSSFETIEEVESFKTVTLYANKQGTNEQTSIFNKNIRNEQQNAPISKVTDNVRSKTEICPCTKCIKEDKVTKNQKMPKTIMKYTNINETKKKIFKYNVEQINFNKNSKVNTGNPYLEITIERPQKEISVDIRSTSLDVSPKNVRPSKIPKRTPVVANNITQTTQSTSKKQDDLKSKHKSLLPQRRTKKLLCAVDDIMIKNRDTSTRERKLNVTL